MEYNESLVNASFALLTERAPLHLLWSVLAPFGVLCNVLVIVTISFDKDLHNKSQFVILVLSLSEIAYMGSVSVIGLKRYLLHILHIPGVTNSIQCSLEVLVWYVGLHWVRYTAFFLAVDRFLCVCLPVFYNTLNTLKYLLAINGMILLPAIFLRGYIQLFGYDKVRWIPICGQEELYERNSLYNRINTIETPFKQFIPVPFYIIATIRLYMRYRKAKLVNEAQKRDWRRLVEFDVFVAITIVGCTFFVVNYIPNIFGTVATAFSWPLQVIQLAQFPFVALNSMSHLFVYLKFNSTFRRAFLKVICRRNNVVQPLF